MDLNFTIFFALCFVTVISVNEESSVIEEQACRKEQIEEFVSNLENAFDNCKPTENQCATKADLIKLKNELVTTITEQIDKLRKETKDICDHDKSKQSKSSTSSTTSATTNYPEDCGDIENANGGELSTGIYTIYPYGNTSGLAVRCETGGWTVIQRRVSDSDFYKDWQEYEEGFGNLNENFWMGNKYIHWITSQAMYTLRIDLTSMDSETAYAEYKEFMIGDADSGYKLIVKGYSGTAGDSFTSRGNGEKFTTKDKDNDAYSTGNCAVAYHGAWWYDACHTSNLNGDYGNKEYAKGPVWQPWKGYYSPMKTIEMKIRQLEN